MIVAQENETAWWPKQESVRLRSNEPAQRLEQWRRLAIVAQENETAWWPKQESVRLCSARGTSRAAAGTAAALNDRRPGERDSVVAEARKCEALFE